MNNFVIGEISAIVIFTLGVFCGYVLGSKQIDRTIRRIRSKISKPSPTSGPVPINSGPVQIKSQVRQDKDKTKNIFNKLIKGL
jgi:hypothetical protein